MFRQRREAGIGVPLILLPSPLAGEGLGVRGFPRTVSQSLPVLGSVRNIPVLDPLRRPCTGGDPDNTSPSRHDVAGGLCSSRPANGRSPADTRWAANKLSAHVPAPKPTQRRRFAALHCVQSKPRISSRDRSSSVGRISSKCSESETLANR
jgi:hypothetical protein